LVFEGKP